MGHGQSQSGTVGFGGEKRFEYPLLQLEADAGAGVADPDLGAGVVLADADGYLAAGLAGLQGVDHQVE